MSLERKVLIATKKPFYYEARDEFTDLLMQKGIEVVVLQGYESRQQFVETMRAVNPHYLFVRSDKVDREIIDAAPNLKLIVRGGSGFETIDKDYADSREIQIDTTPGTNSTSVAELAFEMMGRFLRGLDEPSAKFYGEEFEGRRFAIHGLGRIGTKMGRIGNGYGMVMSAFDTNPSHEALEAAIKYGVTRVESEEQLYDGADIVSLHIPLNGDNLGRVNAGLISRMRHDGILINTARPKIVNNTDLVRVMQTHGWDKFRYGVDAEQEGPEELKKYLETDGLSIFGTRVYATPKIGAQTKEASFNTMRAAAQKIIDFHRKDVQIYVLPVAVVYREGNRPSV